MLTRIALTGLLLLSGTNLVCAADPLVPPIPTSDDFSAPPVPQPPVSQLPIAPAPQTQIPSAPAPMPPAPRAIPDPVYAAPMPTTVAPVPTVPHSSTPSYQYVPQQTTTTHVQQYGVPQYVSPYQPYYLYQPTLGTTPASQSQYNTFSTTGYPTAPQSFSTSPGKHDRYPYYSYRRPWYTPGPASHNVNIIW
ncbi:hypothetical protein [Planctomicrobium piriforme]|uniref:Uncharacterized protein n=1 Tax=Planctomicrobium piriforme TaxID=1576369 RepID=A0A1I3JAF7_9PLAN|nr:hypothetical protein [Planctomicrobium piriforme]SFI57179.1 hypothetical protein SAMN05421753_110111 [Planctomicrobium piriforme]